jgi:hypothetical protein
MNALRQEAILQEIEELRAELIGKVNANVDAFIQRLTGNCGDGDLDLPWERLDMADALRSDTGL